jgi:putative FmdB family regulatory protein
MSKWVLFDFRCRSCGHEFEHLVKQGGAGEPQPCPECQAVAGERQVSVPHFDTIGMATDGRKSSDAMTSTIDKWEKMRRQRMTIEKRNMERHGTYR